MTERRWTLWAVGVTAFLAGDREAGRRLARPTLGKRWAFISQGNDLLIEFGSETIWSDRRWQYDVVAKTWTEYGE